MHDTTAPVLITGGSGFLATHIILRLLNEGYRVRTTVRSLDRAPEVRTMLERAGADTTQLSFVAADLTIDDGWPPAVAGCEYVLHVASPFSAAATAERGRPRRARTRRHAAGVAGCQ